MQQRLWKVGLSAALCILPGLALAHPGHDESGLLAGISHPLSGLDHLLAMVAVGLWAAQQQGARRWQLPLTFLASMLLGGLLGFAGWSLPWVESGIAASVLAFGLIVMIGARVPALVALGTTAVFGICHGIAHGMELPEMNSPWAYAAGFLLATAALHGAGYAVLRLLPKSSVAIARWAGGVCAVFGIGLLVG